MTQTWRPPPLLRVHPNIRPHVPRTNTLTWLCMCCASLAVTYVGVSKSSMALPLSFSYFSLYFTCSHQYFYHYAWRRNGIKTSHGWHSAKWQWLEVIEYKYFSHLRFCPSLFPTSPEGLTMLCSSEASLWWSCSGVSGITW